MFEVFTDQAHCAIVLARKEAQRLNHANLGTEHLLLALIQDRGVAGRMLKNFEITLEDARQNVVEMTYTGDEGLSDRTPFTSRVKNVLVLGWAEAIQFGHRYIDPEHILFGIIREGGGIAVQILMTMCAERSVEHLQDYHRLQELVIGGWEQ